MKSLEPQSGIYLITSTLNAKRYVGSAVNLDKRRRNHLSDLKKESHRNRHLQRHYNKHGDVFKFTVLKKCPTGDLLRWEQDYIDKLKPEFNICKIAGSCLGVKHTEEARRKNSNAKRGENHPNYGKRNSEDTRRRISEAKKGKVCSEDTKRKISEALKGTKHTEEQRRKNSEGHKGEKNGFYGKTHSKEARRKISEANKGRVGNNHTKITQE